MRYFFEILEIFLTILGSLVLFLFGMKVMSDGLQKAAGNRLQNTLNLMTRNRVLGVLTGTSVTALIQSSSATTVMVVSFANAGLITLKQSIGVIMGANIGTTVTAWLVSIVSVVSKFNILSFFIIILAFVLPLMFSKKEKLKNTAEAFIGLTIIFIGLHFLKEAMPDFKQNKNFQLWLANLSGDLFHGYHIILFVLIGAGITAIVQSSSAVTAIAITLVVQGIFPFQPVAALVIGSNIGTTITAYLASLGANLNARRVSMAHILFNLAGAIWVILLFGPFVKLVQIVASPIATLLSSNSQIFAPFFKNGVLITQSFGDSAIVETSKIILQEAGKITKGLTDSNIVEAARALIIKKEATIQVSVFHTLFNLSNTLLLIGFVPSFAKLVEKILPDKEKTSTEDGVYKLKYLSAPLQDTPELNIQHAKVELKKMAQIIDEMYQTFITMFLKKSKNNDDILLELKKKEDYTDQMQEQLSIYLANCAQENLNTNSLHNVSSMVRIAHELENIGDSCYNLGIIANKKVNKDIIFSDEAYEKIIKFTQTTAQFISFIIKNMSEQISKLELNKAITLEEEIDKMRHILRKEARTRIQQGSDVKAELLYIDMLIHLEHIGDNSLNIAEELRSLKK